MRRSFRLASFVVLAFTIVAATAAAQGTTGTINGTVSDNTGAICRA